VKSTSAGTELEELQLLLLLLLMMMMVMMTLQFNKYNFIMTTNSSSNEIHL